MSCGYSTDPTSRQHAPGPICTDQGSTADNLRLRCFRHSQHEAVEELGEIHVPLIAAGVCPTRALANRAALLSTRPRCNDRLGSRDSFRPELMTSNGQREARPERSERPPS